MPSLRRGSRIWRADRSPQVLIYCGLAQQPVFVELLAEIVMPIHGLLNRAQEGMSLQDVMAG